MMPATAPRDASMALPTRPVTVEDPFTEKSFRFNALKSVQPWTLSTSPAAAPS